MTIAAIITAVGGALAGLYRIYVWRKNCPPPKDE